MLAMLVMLSLVFVSTGCSKRPEKDGNFRYYLQDDNTYYVGVADISLVPEVVVIPDIYNGKYVTGLCESIFRECTTIREITLPKRLTSVANFAFTRCTNLEVININGENMTRGFGKSAISHCENLQTINFNGTKAKWKDMISHSYATWTNETYGYVVNCNDGTWYPTRKSK